MATFKELDSKRSSITKEIKDCLMELNDMNMGMTKSLIDNEGFPLSNVNLYHVKYLRGRVRTLDNDLSNLNMEIESLLPSLLSQNQKAFAKIVSVQADSSSFISGLRSNDLIIEWGSLKAIDGGKVEFNLKDIKNEYLSSKIDFTLLISRQSTLIPITIPHNNELGLQIVIL